MTDYIGQYLSKPADNCVDECGQRPQEPDEKNDENLSASTDKNDENPSDDVSVVFVGTRHKESQVFSSPWPPRPPELAGWPDEWRERWGRLANELHDQGVPWPRDEVEAFRRVRAEPDAVVNEQLNQASKVGVPPIEPGLPVGSRKK